MGEMGDKQAIKRELWSWNYRVRVPLYGNPPVLSEAQAEPPKTVEVRTVIADFNSRTVEVDGVEIPFADIHQLHRAIEHYSQGL